jgi:rhodanese-related sulfurtransferase
MNWKQASKVMAKHSPRFLDLVNAVRVNIRECTVQDVQARIARGDQLLLFDVREDHEWSQGHVPGAKHLAKGIIERDIEMVVPDPDAELVLYCGGGFRSALAADALQKMGYTNVISMDGGFRGWKDAGYAVDTTP